MRLIARSYSLQRCETARRWWTKQGAEKGWLFLSFIMIFRKTSFDWRLGLGLNFIASNNSSHMIMHIDFRNFFLQWNTNIAYCFFFSILLPFLFLFLKSHFSIPFSYFTGFLSALTSLCFLFSLFLDPSPFIQMIFPIKHLLTIILQFPMQYITPALNSRIFIENIRNNG